MLKLACASLSSAAHSSTDQGQSIPWKDSQLRTKERNVLSLSTLFISEVTIWTLLCFLVPKDNSLFYLSSQKFWLKNPVFHAT